MVSGRELAGQDKQGGCDSQRLLLVGHFPLIVYSLACIAIFTASAVQHKQTSYRSDLSICDSASTMSLTGLRASNLSGDITPSYPSLLTPPRGTILDVPAETIVETRMGGTTSVAA